MQGIKNIIFDLGGVILNIDYKRPQEEFRKLGVKEVEKLYSKQKPESSILVFSVSF